MNHHNVRVLTDSEINAVAGGTGTCTYEGKTYSDGAVIVLSNGYTQTCSVGSDGSGTWGTPVAPPPAPRTEKLAN